VNLARGDFEMHGIQRDDAAEALANSFQLHTRTRAAANAALAIHGAAVRRAAHGERSRRWISQACAYTANFTIE
jgi:hypothetical protein